MGCPLAVRRNGCVNGSSEAGQNEVVFWSDLLNMRVVG